MTSREPDSAAELTERDEGTWVVRTENGSAYVIDMEQRTCTRILRDPGDHEGGPLALRRDGEDVDLVGVVRCAVGQPAVFFLQLYPGVLTTRTTSAVVSVERA